MRGLQIAVLGAALAAATRAQNEWPSYGGDPEGMRYSRLSQISAGNVAKLKLAWQYGVKPANTDGSVPNRIVPSTEAVPIMAAGLLFTPTVDHSIAALEPETGKEFWKYDLPGGVAAPLRGVTYWPGNSQQAARIFAGLSNGRLIALNAKPGKLIPGFGDEGVLDLRTGVTARFPDAPYHMSSPGVRRCGCRSATGIRLRQHAQCRRYGPAG